MQDQATAATAATKQQLIIILYSAPHGMEHILGFTTVHGRQEGSPAQPEFISIKAISPRAHGGLRVVFPESLELQKLPFKANFSAVSLLQVGSEQPLGHEELKGV